MGPDELIDAYLYDLRAALRTNSRERDRIVAEVDDHLWQSWEDYLAEGLSSAEAARLAIARFGGANDVAASFPRESAASTFAHIYFALATLVGSALIVIGLAALIALPVHAILGAKFIFGPDGQWTAPNGFCNQYASGADCQQAWDEFFLLRTFTFGTAMSLFGGAIVAAHVVGRTFAFGDLSRRMIVTGTVMFGLISLAAIGGGTLKYVFGPQSGWNTWLPAGIASMIVAAAYAFVLRRIDERRDRVLA